MSLGRLTLALTLSIGCAEVAGPDEGAPATGDAVVSPGARGDDAGLPRSMRDPTRDASTAPTADARASTPAHDAASTPPPVEDDAALDAARPDPDAGAGPVPDAEPRAPDAAPAGPDAAPPCDPESCNGIDDDCDGIVDEQAGCPCDVEVRGTSAYLICADRRAWTEAADGCAAVGYTLVVIEDGAEDAFVYGEIDRRGLPDTWIGFNDRETEGRFVWLDGVPGAYTHWDGGEPNNGGNGGEDCAVLMTADGRRTEWDDRPCGTDRPYVCEAVTGGP